MPNNLSALTPTIIASAGIKYLKRRSGLLGKIYVESVLESNLQGGGTSIVIPLPHARRTPTAVSYSSPSTGAITIPSVTVDVTTHIEDRISVNELESRTAQGNFARAFDLTFGSMLDGIVTDIDSDLCALYASAGETVGTGGTAIDDDDIRSAIQKLAENDVVIDPETVHFVSHPSTYWGSVMGEANYNLALNIGRAQPGIQTGAVGNIYGVDFGYSNNIVQTTVSDVTTTHNLMFDRDGFCVAFKKFEAASKYGEPNVQEDIVTDPDTGITMRAQKFYDAELRTWVYALDCCYGVKVLDATRIVEVKS